MAPPLKPLTGPDDPRHGTRQGYRKGCRLACCRMHSSKNRQRAKRRTQREIEHGELLSPDQVEDAWFLLDTGESHPEAIASRIDAPVADVKRWLDQVRGDPRPREFYFSGTVRRTARTA